MLRLGCLLLIVLSIAVPIATAPYLPWWGTIGVLLIQWGVLLLVVPVMARAGMRGIAERLFSVKSRVLRDATIEIHRCVRVTAPPRRIPPALDGARDANPFPLEPQPEPDAPRPHWHVLVDCTITPRPPKGPMQTWDPGDLSLCPYEKDVSFRATARGRDTSDEGTIASARLNQPDSPEIIDTDLKREGPARLELVFGLPESLRPGQRVKLRYYFESLGDFRLPG